MFSRAIRTELDFLNTSKGLYQAVRDGELVMISITMDMTLEDVAYPFVLPKTRAVLNAFAKRYHAACGERLVVTSASRPRREQPRNASKKSVHPTGMAVDFRRPIGNCLPWIRQELVALERKGVLEATEERHPVHFHVAVLQRGSIPAATPAVSTAATILRPGGARSPTVAASPASIASANGEVLPSESVPEPNKAATQSPKPAGKQAMYTVRKGDTQSQIAKNFGLSVARLRSINRLRSSALRPGQKLRVR